MCTMKRRDHTWVTWQSNWLPGRRGTSVIKNIPVCSTRLLNVSWLAVIRGVEQMYCFWSGIIGTLLIGTFLASAPPVLWWPVLCDVPGSWLSAVIREGGEQEAVWAGWRLKERAALLPVCSLKQAFWISAHHYLGSEWTDLLLMQWADTVPLHGDGKIAMN